MSVSRLPVDELLIPYIERYQIKQHSPEWYSIRETLVTASKVAGYLECSQYGPPISKSELLETLNPVSNETKDKAKAKKGNVASAKKNKIDMPVPQDNNMATAFGILHEDVARLKLEKRYGIQIHELGLTIHNDYKWLGASPDGIFVVKDLEGFGIEPNQQPVCLVEIKCPYNRQITHKIPFEYWAQMQIQMEVWNIDYVLYSENIFSKNPDVTDPADLQVGDLEQFWDVVVQRDRHWFQRIVPILQQNKQRLTKEKRLFWDNSFNPNQIRNWINNDPLLDWLDRYNHLDPNLYKRDPAKKYDLAKFASQQTRLFHKEILDYFALVGLPVVNVALTWYERVRPTIGNHGNHGNHGSHANNSSTMTANSLVTEPIIYKSYGKHALTMKALFNRVPIIADAILVDESNNRWGKADLLVREDYLDKLFAIHPSDISNSNISHNNDNARNDGEHSQNVVNYKYYVVLTRFASLRLTADGVHMLNDSKQKLYKAYISFLTDCLPADLRSENGFIIGRKAAWVKQSKSFKKEGFSESLGQVSLTDRDAGVPLLVEASIVWLKRLKQEGQNWRPEGELMLIDSLPVASLTAGASDSRIASSKQPEPSEFCPAKLVFPRLFSKRLSERNNKKRKQSPKEKVDSDNDDEATEKLDDEDTTEKLDDEDATEKLDDEDATEKLDDEEATESHQQKRRRTQKNLSSLLTVKRPIELCPNMKNKNDHPWHNAKKRIAKQTGEITDILNIGPDKRNKMITEGNITRWTDIKPEDLVTYKISDKGCVENILRANQKGLLIGFDEVKDNLPRRYDIECFVDFETVTDLNERIGSELFDSSPGIKSVQTVSSSESSNSKNKDKGIGLDSQPNIIYMIGCYVRNYKTNKDEYLNYLIRTIDPVNEQRILTDWMNDLNKIFGASNSENESGGSLRRIPVYHWSPAEVVQLRRVKKSYGSKIRNFINRMKFIDLYKIFKEARVGIPGAFGYGLKTVAKSLHSLGKIANTWEENLNGADAMVAAWYLNGSAALSNKKISGLRTVERLSEELKDAAKEEQPSDLDKLAKEIILYNYYDCKVMEEIVEFTRQYN
jgi:hypothetical protein